VIYLDTTWWRGSTGARGGRSRGRCSGSSSGSPCASRRWSCSSWSFSTRSGRSPSPARRSWGPFAADLGVEVCDLPFPEVVRCALAQSWTRDPFDRVIVAQAAVRSARLLTKDQTIRDHYQHALWLE